jgi:hypothetical protein
MFDQINLSAKKIAIFREDADINSAVQYLAIFEQIVKLSNELIELNVIV